MEQLRADGIGTQLRRLVELMDGDLEAIYREDHPEYTPRFTPIIKALADADSLTIKEIAAQSNISHSAASQTISRIIEKGFVQSAVDDDRRARLISLTREGAQLLPWLKDQWEATQHAADELDCELSHPLSALLTEAIMHLESRSFAERIKFHKNHSKEGESMLRILAIGAGLLAVLAAPDAAAAGQPEAHRNKTLIVSKDTKSAVVSAVLGHLRDEYVDLEVGQSAADELEEMHHAGHFKDAKGPKAFATKLSGTIQRLTGDGHLNVEFSAKPIDLKNDESEESFSAQEMEKYYGAGVNYGVQRIEHLEGNVGYLDLRVFAPIDMGGPSVTSAMTVLAPTSALIIDLRKNGGGIGDMADLVASYLFDEQRQPLTGTYDRPSDTLTQRFTQPMVPGRRFGPDKPVYVLISKRTFSAAEALAYNLQALGRATIVGETSGGGAHPFEYKPIHKHFVLWSVTAKSVNPITQSNWQGVGVKPDITVPAAEALQHALSLVANKQDPEKTL